jgi:hypothetical protein
MCALTHKAEYLSATVLSMRATVWIAVGLLLPLFGGCEAGRHDQRIRISNRDTVSSIAASPSSVTHSDTILRECNPLWPDKVQFSGVLRAEKKFGPPGYGETPDRDQRLTIYILHLSTPETICGGFDGNLERPEMKDVRRLQLVGRIDRDFLEHNLGNRIWVWGTLSHRTWATDFTSIILRADSVSNRTPAMGQQS